jgi:hypothetical protein
VKTTNVFFINIFRAGLQPYLRLASAGMIKDTLVKHKEAVVISLLKFLICLLENFGKKRPSMDRHKKNLLVILDKSF